MCTYTASIESRLESLGRMSALQDLKLQALEPCGTEFGKYCNPDSSSYSYSQYGGPKKPAQVAQELTATNEKNWLDAQEIHQRILPKIEINKQIKKGLEALFLHLGFPMTSKIVDTKSRSRYTKYITKTEGWKETVDKIQCNDHFEYSAQQAYNTRKSAIAEYVRKHEAVEAQKVAAQAAEEKAKTSLLELARFQVKYGLRVAADYSEVLDVILSKNKYLHLGHYLLRNRNDWNDGPSYAETGLGNFRVESDLDQKIYDDINGRIQDWDHDGRTFRDSPYGYDYLFSLVLEQDLLDDYHTCSTHIPI